MKFCLVGAGFSGAVIGRALAEAGHDVLIVDERAHIGGNCHCAPDRETGVLTHVYGRHIFHTADARVWAYVQNFATMMPYHHRVRAIAGGAVYTLPVNLMTINQVFGTAMRPAEAKAFVASKAIQIEAPKNFEEQALSTLGEDLYRLFFRGYTRKQWGVEPTQLPASVLKRLPLRFDYDDSYFAHPHQAIPKDGYTRMIAAILSAPRLETRLGTRSENVTEPFDHVIYRGPIDRFFDYRLGRLGTYHYLDMDVTIGEALKAADRILELTCRGAPLPTFFAEP